MGRVVDITDKLDFESNPKLIVKGKEYEVNADAETVLRIMGVVGNKEDITTKDIVQMYELIFSDKVRKEIAKLKLQFDDFKTLVESAVNLIVNDGEEKKGE